MPDTTPDSGRAPLTNSEFLAALGLAAPPGSALWVTSFFGSPEVTEVSNWFGKPAGAFVDNWADRNTYFSVAALKPTGDGEIKRRKANFARLLALVVDDVALNDVQGSVSWVIETSPGKTQVGILIDGDDPAAADIGLVDRLVTNMAERGMMGGDRAGNNAVRWVRLPVGCNLKPRQSGAWRHVVQQWNPGVVLSLEDAAAAFGVDLDRLDVERRTNPTPASTGLVTGAQDERLRVLMGNVIRGENLHDSLNQIAASLVASGVHGGTVVNTLRALMDASLAAKDERWVARYQDIPRCVRTAEEKFSRPKAVEPAEGDEEPEWRLTRAQVDFSRLRAVEWVLEGFIAARQLVVFAGQPGVGKSTVFSAIALIVAGFGPDIGSDIKNDRIRRVAIVSEHAEQFERLFYGFIVRFHLNPAAVASMVTVYDAARLKVEEIPGEICHIVEELGGHEPPFVILDTASAMFDVADENNNAEIASMLAALKQPVSKTGAPIWVIAHAAKALGREDSEITPRGASAYAGDVHATGSVFRDKNIPDSTFIRSLKNRNEREYHEIEVKTEVSWHQVADDRGVIQRVGLRLGIPMMSAESKRREASERARESAKASEHVHATQALDDAIRIALAAAIAAGELLTASDIAARVPGRKSSALERVTELVDQGELVVEEWPRALRPHPKKTNFHRFPQTDVEILISAFSAQKSST